MFMGKKIRLVKAPTRFENRSFFLEPMTQHNSSFLVFIKAFSPRPTPLDTGFRRFAGHFLNPAVDPMANLLRAP